MQDPIDRLIEAEATFRAEVIFALRRECERLHHHRGIVDQQGGSHTALRQIIERLDYVAGQLDEQDGQMARALGRRPSPALAAQPNST